MVDKGVEACRNLLHKREQWQHVGYFCPTPAGVKSAKSEVIFHHRTPRTCWEAMSG